MSTHSQQLPNGDRQMTVLAGTAHSIAVAHNRHQFWHVMKRFLEMPASRAAGGVGGGGG
ncbi:MAG: hypothetical protein WCP29_02885 [Acidobacteriota bacterium]